LESALDFISLEGRFGSSGLDMRRSGELWLRGDILFDKSLLLLGLTWVVDDLDDFLLLHGVQIERRSAVIWLLVELDFMVSARRSGRFVVGDVGRRHSLVAERLAVLSLVSQFVQVLVFFPTLFRDDVSNRVEYEADYHFEDLIGCRVLESGQVGVHEELLIDC
jgi:hypothetical protein